MKIAAADMAVSAGVVLAALPWRVCGQEDAVDVPVECSNCTVADEAGGAPEWAVAMLTTLLIVSLLVCFAVLAFLYQRLRRAKLFEDIDEGETAKEAALFASGIFDDDEIATTPTMQRMAALKQADADRLTAALLHAHTMTPPGDLPDNPSAFPRGPGNAFLAVTQRDLVATLSFLHARMMQLWYAKRGDIFDELLSNLRFPLQHATNAHVVIQEVAQRMWKERKSKDWQQFGPLQHFCLALLTQEAADTDRLMLFEDAPVWIPGSGVCKRAWSSYEPRNDCVARELDEEAAGMIETRGFGDREQALGRAKKWIKASFLASLMAEPGPASSVSTLPVYKAYREGRVCYPNSYIFFLSPLACSSSAQSTRQFLHAPSSLPTLFRIFNVDRQLPVHCIGQYPVEETVFLPMMTLLKVESVRMEGKMQVVDLKVEDNARYLDWTQLKRAVLEDAASAEARLERVGLLLTDLKGKPPQRRAGLTQREHVRLDKSGCVSTVEETVDATRCHECGGFAHGMPHRYIDEIEGLSGNPLSTVLSVKREAPETLWIVGALPQLSGAYRVIPNTESWRSSTRTIRRVENRWVVSEDSEPNSAVLCSAEDCDVTTQPHDVVRWTRPVRGQWTEETSLRVLPYQPTDLFTVHANPAGSSVRTTSNRPRSILQSTEVNTISSFPHTKSARVSLSPV